MRMCDAQIKYAIWLSFCTLFCIIGVAAFKWIYEKQAKHSWEINGKRGKKQANCICVCVYCPAWICGKIELKRGRKKASVSFARSHQPCSVHLHANRHKTWLHCSVRFFFLSFWKMSHAIPFGWQILAVILCSNAIHVGASQFVSVPHILYCH